LVDAERKVEAALILLDLHTLGDAGAVLPPIAATLSKRHFPWNIPSLLGR
jgi:hypothetical protein